VLPARFAGGMRGTKVAVGDRVRVKPPRHETDEARIVELLDRRTVLLRTADDAEDDERVVVANADTVIVVLAADYLEVGARFLDRVLVAASTGGLDPVLCINKVDLVADRSEVEAVRRALRGHRGRRAGDLGRDGGGDRRARAAADRVLDDVHRPLGGGQELAVQPHRPRRRP
jgi:hypothetical protein